MLVMTRKIGEVINIYVRGVKVASITPTEVYGGKCRLGISAEKEVEIWRREIDPYVAVAPPRVVRGTGEGEAGK